MTLPDEAFRISIAFPHLEVKQTEVKKASIAGLKNVKVDEFFADLESFTCIFGPKCRGCSGECGQRPSWRTTVNELRSSCGAPMA